MKKSYISILIAAITASVLVCCSKQSETDPKIPENGDGQYQSLELTSVRESEFQSKAVLDGELFPQDGHIGLFLFADAAASQTYGDGYTNVDYSYNSQKGKWTASPSIKVGSTPGYLYGYYPYKAGTQQQPVNIKAIPVVSSFNGDDVMYATPQDPITAQTAGNVSVTMKHALARVAITVVNKGYTGDAKLQSIKFAGAEIAESGTLNAVDGTITATKAQAVTLTVPEASQAIATGSGSIYECLLVPSAVKADRQNVALTLKIDGQEKSANLTGDNGVIFGSGVKSRIVINLSNSGISVSSVSIDDWQTVKVGEHKVTVKLEDDVPGGDVLVSAIPVSETSAEVRAISYRGTLLVCSRDDDESAVTPTVSGNYHYFTIDNITKDVVATVDYLKHTLSLTAVLDTMGTFKINGNPGPSAIIVDGTEVPIEAVPNANHRFVKWTDDESTTNPRTVTITSDSTFTAEFIRQWKVCAKLASGCEGMGTFKYDGVTATEKIADHGSKVVIHPEANDGYEFLKWVNENGDEVSNLWDYTFSNIDSDKSIKAVFVECIHEISGEPLPGVFTLADPDGEPGSGDETKIRFSRGNLWCDGTGDGYTESSPVIKSWGFENHQYDCPPHIHTLGPSWLNNSRVITHIGHFMWFSTASRAVRHFGQSDHVPPFSLFAENYFSTPDGGKWRVLTTYEWDYLFSTHPKKLGVNVNGNLDCIIVLPDNWDETVMTKNAFSEKNSYSAQEWSEMEAAGAVCLPCAGCSFNNASDIRGTATDANLPYFHYNRYWTPIFAGGLAGSNQKTAYCLKFEHSDEVQFDEQIKFDIYDWVPMGYGLAIRLVTDVK